jgi:hypothetical protein
MIGAALMLLHSLTGMFDSWENVKSIHACLDAVRSNAATIQDCQTQAGHAFDILLRANQTRMTDLQIVYGLFPKIANVFFWVGGFIIGMVLYRSWKIVLPIEENMMEVRPVRWKGKKK